MPNVSIIYYGCILVANLNDFVHLHFADTSADLKYGDRTLHVSMLPNPSHLEAANPVAVGKARAKQLQQGEGHYGDGSTQMGDKVGRFTAFFWCSKGWRPGGCKCFILKI